MPAGSSKDVKEFTQLGIFYVGCNPEQLVFDKAQLIR
jgi:tRNA/tmRNA/rRNA uracil-C5-methylase (TrmA/RlmC/RlmD family)